MRRPCAKRRSNRRPTPNSWPSPPTPDDIYTPAVTLGAFLSQALSSGKSCVAAVARVRVFRVALGQAPGSAPTGGYGKARAQLAEGFLRRLTEAVGEAIEDQAPDAWLAVAWGVEVAFRLQQRRKYAFSHGRRRGRDDQVLVWVKPARPAWRDEAT